MFFFCAPFFEIARNLAMVGWCERGNNRIAWPSYSCSLSYSTYAHYVYMYIFVVVSLNVDLRILLFQVHIQV